jgi:DNA-binding transcriptional MerR regulator
MRIGEVARRSGVPAHTIRFYETRNVVARPARTRAGYRVYSDQVIGELDFVRRAQGLGFSLDEIKEILALGRGGKLPCARVAAMCDAHLRAIDERLAELRRFQRHLRDAQRQAKSGCGYTPEGFCRAIMGLGDSRSGR